jgi:hypothetical protein
VAGSSPYILSIMSARTVDFNRLPASVRERFIACTENRQAPLPIVSDQLGMGLALFGWGSLLVLSAIGLLVVVTADFGEVYGSGLQEGAWIAAYVILGFLTVYSLLAMIRRKRLISSLPYRPGRYLFPMDFVDAKSDKLRLLPMSSMVNFQGTHHHTNGVYSHTDFVFQFEGGVSESIQVRGKDIAERALEQLRVAQYQIAEAVQNRNVEALYAGDVFFEARVEDRWEEEAQPFHGGAPQGPTARPLSPLLRRASLAALAVSLLGVPAWYLRNLASDAAIYASLEEYGSEVQIQMYVANGGRRAAEAEETLLPAAALREAKAAGSVTALRGVRERYPKSDEAKTAKKEIGKLFKKTVADFDAQAADEATMRAFMGRLFKYLEKNDSPPVLVRFATPSATELTEADALLNKEVPGGVEPISGHFDLASSAPREAAIVKYLQDAFSAIFPADVLSLQQGKRLTKADLEREVDEPTIKIHYDVTWSGDTYVSEMTKKNFVGIKVKFLVSMRLPGEAVDQTFSFPLEVLPPERFQVGASPLENYGVGAYNGADDAGRVYHAMALNAFGELATKMRAVFFRPGTQAFLGQGARPSSFGPSDVP